MKNELKKCKKTVLFEDKTRAEAVAGCPFCGKSEIITEAGEGKSTRFRISCYCRFANRAILAKYTQEEAVTEWNAKVDDIITDIDRRIRKERG